MWCGSSAISSVGRCAQALRCDLRPGRDRLVCDGDAVAVGRLRALRVGAVRLQVDPVARRVSRPLARDVRGRREDRDALHAPARSAARRRRAGRTSSCRRPAWPRRGTPRRRGPRAPRARAAATRAAAGAPATAGGLCGGRRRSRVGDQRAARHLGRLRLAEQLQDGRRDVGEDPAVSRSASPGTVTISGTGLSECAVFGEPSGSSMWSALPWSAVIDAGAAARVHRSDDLAEAAVDRLDRRDRRRDHAGVADHVGVREVDDPEARLVLAARRATNAAAASGALICGLWS